MSNELINQGVNILKLNVEGFTSLKTEIRKRRCCEARQFNGWKTSCWTFEMTTHERRPERATTWENRSACSEPIRAGLGK